MCRKKKLHFMGFFCFLCKTSVRCAVPAAYEASSSQDIGCFCISFNAHLLPKRDHLSLLVVMAVCWNFFLMLYNTFLGRAIHLSPIPYRLTITEYDFRDLPNADD
jgi:hypothetical protein